MEVNSDYIKVVDKNSNLTVIAFSADAEVGKFQYFNTFEEMSCNVIFVNSKSHRYYHFGIEGIGDITKSISVLKKICSSLGGGQSRVVTFGCSMGGYGALLYGSLLAVDKIIAFSPSCPLYTLRQDVANDMQRHKERYFYLKEVLFNASTKKELYFGSVDYSDYLSYAEFSSLKNNRHLILEGASHTVVQPLLKYNGIKALIEGEVNLSDVALCDLTNDINSINSYAYALTSKNSSEFRHNLLAAWDNVSHIGTAFTSHVASLMLHNLKDLSMSLQLFKEASQNQTCTDPHLVRLALNIGNRIPKEELKLFIDINTSILANAKYVDTMVGTEIKKNINVLESYLLNE